MALRNGSDEYWEIVKHAERIYRKKCDNYGSERERWAKKGFNLADRLREDYGYRDPEVKFIIEKYYLDRS